MNHDEMVALIKNAPDAGTAAGAWWASVLRAPEFDAGADNPAGEIAQVLARQLSAANPQDGSALEVFAGKLAKKINEKLKRPGDYGINLSVDYHPDMMLREAAQEANLNIGELGWPWKTHMRITSTQVTVRAGYGASSEIIWGELEEVSV